MKRAIQCYCLLLLFACPLLSMAQNITWFRDIDGDGWGNPNISQIAGSKPPGFVQNSLDCNDLSFNNIKWDTAGPAGGASANNFDGKIAIDKNGEVYVAHSTSNGSGAFLTVNKLVGNVWTLVGNQVLVSPFLSELCMAIDGNGVPYVAYGDASQGGRLTVRRFNGTSWELVGAAGFSIDAAFHINIAIDATDTPHVIYNSNGETFVRKFNGSLWAGLGILSSSTENNVITFDKFNRPAIGGGGFRAVVKIFNGTVWNTIGNADFSSGAIRETSLAFDKLNNPYFGYRETGTFKPSVMKFNTITGLWDPLGTINFTADTALTPCMVIDSANTVLVGFQDYAHGKKATLMKFDGTTWVTVGNAGFSTGFASNTQLAVSPTGIPYMLFADQQHFFLGTVMKMAPLASPPTLTSISPSHNPVCINRNETLAINGSLNDAADWKWYTSSCGGTLKGTGATLNINQNISTTYFVRAEGTCLAAPSSCVNITVSPLIPVLPSVSIAASPSSSVPLNTPISFAATPVNGGTTPSYQWLLNNVAVGTNSSNYSLTNPQHGDTVLCNLTSSQYCVTSNDVSSNAVRLTITNPITVAEYFIDADPGAGNGTAISITSGDTTNFSTNISTVGLLAGFHTLFIRTKQSDGSWGLFESRGFQISATSANTTSITAAEYFIDADPGVGNGTPITITTGDTVNFSQNIPTTSLSIGFHTLFVRVKDTNANWNLFESRGFQVSASSADVTNIVAAEYFIDADPGIGNGLAMNIGAAAGTVNFSSAISVASFGNGFHNLFIRTKDADGHWNLFESRGFYITTATTDVANITAAEYFIDADPGIGNGLAMSIGAAGGTVNFSSAISIASLGTGFHNLFIRTKDADNNWGLFESRGFYVSQATANVSNIQAAEFFIDTDPGLGNATSLTINTPGSTINQLFTCAVPPGLINGQHFLFIRVKGLDGNWGLFERDTFMVNNAIIQWTGNTSTDWNNAGNWSSGTVPNAASANVLVAVASNQPSINASTFTVGEFSMAGSTTLNIASASSLQVAGSMSNNGTISGNGELMLNGPSAQTIQGIGSIANLTLNNSNGISIVAGSTNKLSITNTLLPTSGILATNGNLILASSALGTARIAAGNIAGGYITGNVTMQRFVPGGFRKYRFVGHPFSAAMNLTELSDDIDITGAISGSNANNFVTTSSNNPSAFTFVESNDDGIIGPNNNAGWLPFTSGNSISTLAQGKAARILIRGTKGQTGSLTGGVYTPNAVTINMTGNLQQGNFVQALDFSSVSKGWNLISNPYASNIDWTNVTRSNVDNAVYTYRPALSGGNYGSYVNGSSANGGSQFIESSSGFFVRANAALPTLTWHETDKVSSNPTNSVFRIAAIHNRLSLTLTNNNDQFTDEVVLRFGDDKATDGFDREYDAANLAGSIHDLFVLDNAQNKYSIYHGSELKTKQQEHREILLGLDNLLAGSYSITARTLNALIDGHKAYLKDAVLNTLVEITDSIVYSFNMATAQASVNNRFSIVFNAMKEITPPVTVQLTLQAMPNPFMDFIQLSYNGLNEQEPSSLSVIDMDGKLLKVLELGKISFGKSTIATKEWAKGSYTLRLANAGSIQTKVVIKQ